MVLRLEGAAAHLDRNTQELSKIADFLPMAMACLTPLEASQQPALAIVDITFPERVRSLCVMFRSGADRDGEVQLSYRLDEGPEVPVGPGQLLANSRQLPDPEVLEVAVGEPGCRRFRLVARMRSVHDHAEGVAVRHLASFVCGGHVESDPACLAVVADPESISWFAEPAVQDGSHRRTRWNALTLLQPPEVDLAERTLAELPVGWLPGAMVLEPGRKEARRLEAVVTMSHGHSTASPSPGQFLRVDLQSGAQADPLPTEVLSTASPILLSVADADGDRQRDFLLGDSFHSSPGYHSGRVLLVSSATGRELHTWQMPPVGSMTPHHQFGGVLQPVHSHATDTLFVADARGYPGGDAKLGAIVLLDTRSKQAVARVDGADPVPDLGLNLVPIAEPVDLDGDQLLEFATLRPMGSRANRESPPCILEVWSGNGLVQLQGSSPHVIGGPEFVPLYRFLFDARSRWAHGCWVPDTDGDGKPELFLIFLPPQPTDGRASMTMISLPRGVLWERTVRLEPDGQQDQSESTYWQALPVADLDGDSRGDLALLAGTFFRYRILFASSADGSLLGSQEINAGFRVPITVPGFDRASMLHVPDLDGDGFGQLLVPRTRLGPDGQPRSTLALYDLKRLR